MVVLSVSDDSGLVVCGSTQRTCLFAREPLDRPETLSVEDMGTGEEHLREGGEGGREGEGGGKEGRREGGSDGGRGEGGRKSEGKRDK